MAGWIAGTEKEADLDRPEVSDPHVLAIAKMLSKSQVAAFFCSTKTGAWLTMESFHLWVEHGPSPALMATLCSTPMQLIAIGEDYQGAHVLGQHLIRVGEKRGYEPATSVARFMYAFCCSHWFAPLEHSLPMYRKARGGLFQGGDLQYGVFTYAGWLPQFDTAASMLMCLDEIEGADAVCQRTGDKNFVQLHRPSLQLVKSLQGKMAAHLPPGSLQDDTFDEAAYEATVQEASTTSAYYDVTRSLLAAIFNQVPDLHRYSQRAMAALNRVPGNYLWPRVYPLRVMSLGIQLREARALLPAADAPDAEAAVDTVNTTIAALLAELDKCIKWMARRTKDAPMNYRHLLTWMQAERAWALGQHWEAMAGFNQAMDEVSKVVRPWQQALITERAAYFHLAQGLDRSGQPLLQTARDQYDAWGASAKVARLSEAHGFLQARGQGSHGATGRSTVVSTDMVDVLSVLRASQALSSETSLAALSQRVGKVLGAMTGAATVNLLVKPDERAGWQMQVPEPDGEAHTEALDLAVERGRLPLSVFRYAERTREALLLPEATRDERFARDPYFKGQAQCSMLMLPILSKGDLRAMVMLENRLSRGAFSTDRIDAVSMIAGQLAVSLDNALLYASLEQKVTERTAALEEANQRLELLSTTDALTGVANRRKFNEALDAEWLRARRTRQPIGLVLIDIDHFKLYNDHYGHQGGDSCLQQVATAMKAGLRAGSDLIARYGGEEFVLLLPNTDLAGAMVVAERVRAAVEARHEPHQQSAKGIVTVSLGVTSFVPGGDTRATQYVEFADQALYEAKRGGRNQVVASPGKVG
jgi:diguanylate cyclase (GGDEF)-like protein